MKPFNIIRPSFVFSRILRPPNRLWSVYGSSHRPLYQPHWLGMGIYFQFHNLTVPSALPDARAAPSGEKETLKTTPSCSLSVADSLRLATSHNLTVPS